MYEFYIFHSHELIYSLYFRVKLYMWDVIELCGWWFQLIGDLLFILRLVNSRGVLGNFLCFEKCLILLTYYLTGSHFDELDLAEFYDLKLDTLQLVYEVDHNFLAFFFFLIGFFLMFMRDELEAIDASSVWKLDVSCMGSPSVVRYWVSPNEVFVACVPFPYSKMNDLAFEFLSFLILVLDFWFDKSTSIRLTSSPFFGSWASATWGLLNKHLTFSLSQVLADTVSTSSPLFCELAHVSWGWICYSGDQDGDLAFSTTGYGSPNDWRKNIDKRNCDSSMVSSQKPPK